MTCAYKWAESPDEVHIFVRWAHKLSAPAVNNVDKSQVFVDIQPSSIGVRGEHKDKTLQVERRAYSRIFPSSAANLKQISNAFTLYSVLRYSRCFSTCFATWTSAILHCVLGKQVSIPLKGNLEVARSTWSLGTFGVTFVLRKVQANCFALVTLCVCTDQCSNY